MRIFSENTGRREALVIKLKHSGSISKTQYLKVVQARTSPLYSLSKHCTLMNLNRFPLDLALVKCYKYPYTLFGVFSKITGRPSCQHCEIYADIAEVRAKLATRYSSFFFHFILNTTLSSLSEQWNQINSNMMLEPSKDASMKRACVSLNVSIASASQSIYKSLSVGDQAHILETDATPKVGWRGEGVQ